ncbi:MAG: DUF3347 domain-containing protein [Balneolaceae bacterium]|nr:DUF3347 domain-containing protein [Balneolaceae bacterium]MDR9407646.1 DUF3347 domain-containing protein [Balneolaceae bacterium]
MKKLFILIALVFLITSTILAQESGNHQHSEHLETLLTEYLEIKRALVNDNFEGAKSALQSFSQEITTNNEMKHHPEHSQMHETHHSTMITAVESASNAENIDQLRNSFDEISAELIKAVKNQNIKTNLHVQFCPMADNGDGARWLSENEEIKTPYYGSMMSTCGSLQEQI